LTAELEARSTRPSSTLTTARPCQDRRLYARYAGSPTVPLSWDMPGPTQHTRPSRTLTVNSCHQDLGRHRHHPPPPNACRPHRTAPPTGGVSRKLCRISIFPLHRPRTARMPDAMNTTVSVIGALARVGGPSRGSPRNSSFDGTQCESYRESVLVIRLVVSGGRDEPQYLRLRG